MTYEQAKKILHPDTTLETLEEIEYYAGFNGEEIFEVIIGNGELKTFSRDELTKTGRNVDISNVISKLTYDEGCINESRLM